MSRNGWVNSRFVVGSKVKNIFAIDDPALSSLAVLDDADLKTLRATLAKVAAR